MQINHIESKSKTHIDNMTKHQVEDKLTSSLAELSAYSMGGSVGHCFRFEELTRLTLMTVTCGKQMKSCRLLWLPSGLNMNLMKNVSMLYKKQAWAWYVHVLTMTMLKLFSACSHLYCTPRRFQIKNNCLDCEAHPRNTVNLNYFSLKTACQLDYKWSFLIKI